MSGLYSKPASGLSAILPNSTILSGKSLHSIVKDIHKANPSMPRKDKIRVSKILKKLNSDPHSVVTNSMTKEVVRYMGSAGHLKSKYKQNLGLAISAVQKRHSAKEEPFSSNVNSGAKKLTSTEKRALERKKRRKKAFLQKQSRERIEEAGEAEADKVIQTRPQKDIHTSSVGMKNWERAKISISQSADKADEHDAENDAGGQSSAKTRGGGKPLIDMVID